ncbi:hypothetical protein MTX78_18750 [Hymenobacter tibetensis]|uniref:STAS/SEC14 domain-containing protein n=1 Tax=Hymenobacter tibetensis TaxID=497967 RepID=A0ABY4CV54_9BACT|nr:hypothetical protein [Hymenobacter tibetensis]UOG74148.1 hypothetical protein MTX78_18750 [Hymenobacter tibetensis]
MNADPLIRVFSASYLRIHHEPKLRSIELEWHAHLQPNEVRTGFQVGMQIAEQRQVQAWIANMTHMGPISSEDQEWIVANWLPRLRLLGLKFLAIVVSDDARNRLSIHNIMSASEQKGYTPAETVYFSSAQDARDWVYQSCCQPTSLPVVTRRF